jgi:type II secretion system protein N
VTALKFPELSARQRWFLFILYLAIVCIALLYYRFPSERFRHSLISELNRQIPGVQVMISQVRPLLPPGLGCFGCAIHHRQVVMAENLSVSIYPHWSSWLGLSRKARFILRAGNGTVDGLIRLAGENGSSGYEMEAQLDSIALKDIAAVEAILKRSARGILNGQVTVRRENQTTKAQARLTLAQGMVGIEIPGVDLQNLEWETFNAELQFDGAKLEIQRGRLSGNQISGQVNGSIMIRTPWEESRLKLQTTVIPQPTLMARLKQSQWGSLLSQMPSTSQGVAVSLRGTVKKPSVSLK